MQPIRTIVWMLVSAILVAFISMNWASAPVNLWPLDTGYLHFNWPVGVIALVFLLLGLLPTWLLSKAGHWGLKRRIASLENALRASAPSHATPSQDEPTADPDLQS